MRTQLVAGNWKMNGSLASNQALAAGARPGAGAARPERSYAVCVPYPYLAQVQRALRGSNIALGAQDVCQFDAGAYTGGVSARDARGFRLPLRDRRAFGAAQRLRRDATRSWR